MRTIFFLFSFVFCLGAPALAQDPAPLLKKLTLAQKIKALEYIRSLGTDIDQEIISVYGQLNRRNQAKTIFYLESIQPETNGKPMRTEVEWSRDTLHFGEITEGQEFIDSITVTNTGQKPYLITASNTACDCTVLQVPDYPLLPGESATIRIGFKSTGKKGKVSTGVVLQDNSRPNARSIIYLKGEVKPKVSAQKKPWED